MKRQFDLDVVTSKF